MPVEPVRFAATDVIPPDPFVTVCPSCGNERHARPPRNGWSRHYLCAECGTVWMLDDDPHAPELEARS